jgi:hypothetical protein
VTLNVADDLHTPGVHLVTQLVRVHPGKPPREAVPGVQRRAVSSRAVLEATDLVVGRIVEHELPASGWFDPPEGLEGRQASHHGLALDVVAMTIELENGRLHPANDTRSGGPGP